MSQVVSFKLSESDLALLEEHKTNNGIASLGLAAKDLLLKALHKESNLSAIEPYLKEIEERVARTSARGTKAALAVMCLQAAQYDKQMMDHLAQLNAGEVFNFAWDMAGSMVAAGQRPGYYKAAKSADFSTSKNLKKVEAIVELAAESDTLYILKSLDEKDIPQWFTAMKTYRECKPYLAINEADTSDEWINTFLNYRQALSDLSEILAKMDIYSPEEFTSHFLTNEWVYSNTQGWIEADEDTRIKRFSRVVSDYCDVLDTNDSDFSCYTHIGWAESWDELLRELGEQNAN